MKYLMFKKNGNQRMCYKYSLSFKIYQLVSVSVFQIFSQNYHFKSIVSADLLNLFCCLFVASFDRVLGIKCWNQFKTKAVKELRASDNIDNDMTFLV